MKLTTTRFGEINIDESKIIVMKGGILGFEHLKKFVLLVHDYKIPFWWLQAVEDGSVAFVVINSFLAMPEYEPVIRDNDVELLEIGSPNDVIPLSVVTIRRSTPPTITANLRAPLIMNTMKRLAKQIVLDDSSYPVQYFLKVKDTAVAGTSDQKRLQDISALLVP